jgi:hypothetical protein
MFEQEEGGGFIVCEWGVGGNWLDCQFVRRSAESSGWYMAVEASPIRV